MLCRCHPGLLWALLLAVPVTASAEDRAIGTGPLEPQLTGLEYPHGITEASLRDLPLDDPKLRAAYYWLMQAARPHPRITDEPNMREILKDIRRRGDSATPLWLDMMEKNPGSTLEEGIPLIIGVIGNIKMEPYVEHLREMIRTRSGEISGSACGTALGIFFRHGTAEDVEMVQEAARNRPFLAPWVRTAFEEEQRRLTYLKTGKPESADPPTSTQTTEQPAPLKVPPVKPAPSVKEEEPASSTPWLAATAAAGVAALGAVWYLIRRRS